MQIITPTETESIVWEGPLEPDGAKFGALDNLPQISIGRPVWWPAAEAIGANIVPEDAPNAWIPPADGKDYTLIRLTFSLHEPESKAARYKEAKLTGYLRPRRAVGEADVIAFDLYPRRLTAATSRKFSIGLSPELTFMESVSLSVIDLGAEIQYNQVLPVVQSYNVGQHNPYWRFQRHESHPLLGAISVYLVAAAPLLAEGIRLSVELTAVVETRFGPIPVRLPQAAQTHTSYVID